MCMRAGPIGKALVPRLLGLGVLFASCLSVDTAWAVPNPAAEDVGSSLSRSTAATTTQTATYVPEVRYPDGLTVLYSAARGGKLEPCGCRALNLGGIDREAAMVRAVRGETSATVYVDAGGFFREFPDKNNRLESWHLLDGLSAARMDAINVGFPDLKEGVDGLKRLAAERKLPFISANIVDASTGQPVFEPFKAWTLTTGGGKQLRVAVIGVTAPNINVSRPAGSQIIGDATVPRPNATSPDGLRSRWTIAPVAVPLGSHHFQGRNSTVQALLEQGGAAPASAGGGNSPAMDFALTTSSVTGAPYTVLDEAKALRPLAERLRKETDVLLLLSYASKERTQEIASAVPLFDIAIAGDYIKRHEAEKIGTRPTLLVAADYDGKYLGQIDLRIAETGGVAEVAPVLHPVLQSIEPIPEFTRYLTAYKQDTENLPVPQSQQTAEKVYAGASSCRTCHADAWTQWRTHHHSRAMKALVDKQMHYNPDCLRCHTVAFRQPGGFTDLRVTPHLSNVQCEVCHGPGQKHVDHHRAAAMMQSEGGSTAVPAGAEHPPELRMEWDAQFCMQCHDPQNDPHFNFEQDILRVRHKDPAPPRERPTTASLMM